MAKLSKLKGADLVVLEFPAKMKLVNNELKLDIPVKRVVATFQSVEDFKDGYDEALKPKVIGTPTGGLDENGLAGYEPFEKEEAEKKAKTETVQG